MPEKKTLERAKAAKRQGKSPSTQAGAFVREQIEHVREGKHGVKSTKQAIAIGLSQARRAGVEIPEKKSGAQTKSARSNSTATPKKTGSKTADATTHKKRAAASLKALKREGSAPVSRSALSQQSRSAAHRRSAAERSAAAKQGGRTKGVSGRSTAAKKAAHTRAAAHR